MNNIGCVGCVGCGSGSNCCVRRIIRNVPDNSILLIGLKNIFPDRHSVSDESDSGYKTVTIYHQLNDDDEQKVTDLFIKYSHSQVKAIEKKHTSKVAEKCEMVLPHSDDFAVYRNGYKLMITVAALALASTALAGAAPVVLGVIALGCCIAGILILAALRYQGKIDTRDALKLGVLTLLSTIPIGLTYVIGGAAFGVAGSVCGTLAHQIQTAIYAVSVMIQGILFAGPQGLCAWGKGGLSKYRTASELGDATHKAFAGSTIFSGTMSTIEGIGWVAMGALSLFSALHGFVPGVPETEAMTKALAWITSTIFIVMFNVSYVNMMITGVARFCHLNSFHNTIKFYFEQKEDNLAGRCSDVLTYLKSQLGTKENLKDPKKFAINAYRLKKMIDCKSFDLVSFEKIDLLLSEIEKGNALAIEISRRCINDIINANEREMAIWKRTIILGFFGLFIGSMFSFLIEATNPGSVFSIPYLQGALSLSDETSNLVSGIVTIADCAFWAVVNLYFKKWLDDPAGRTEEEKFALTTLENDFLKLQEEDNRKRLEMEKFFEQKRLEMEKFFEQERLEIELEMEKFFEQERLLFSQLQEHFKTESR